MSVINRSTAASLIRYIDAECDHQLEAPGHVGVSSAPEAMLDDRATVRFARSRGRGEARSETVPLAGPPKATGRALASVLTQALSAAGHR
jgi:hypothetical protein